MVRSRDVGVLSSVVSIQEIKAAQRVLRKVLQPSPLVYNPWLSETYKCEVYLKLENMQPIGSFKIRGATYRISRLSKEQRKKGVIAASAGNHAQGVAWGSQQFGVNSLIVMPTTAPLVKLQNTQALGAEILLYGNNYDEAYKKAREIANETQRIFIHAFEDSDVIAGQGTLGLELLNQIPDLDYVFASVGGGGLLAGVATAIKSSHPRVKVVGCQSQGAPSMIRSIQKGKAIRLQRVDTFADGIAVMAASEPMRKMLKPLVDEWVEVEENSIAASVLMLIEKVKTVAEGSGAASLAALDRIQRKTRGKKVVLIVSGGNIDVNVLSRVIDMGLIRAGRRVRINVLVSDRPGSLAKLTELIAKRGANILQAIHDRNEPSTQFNQTEVALTLETRGPDHSRALVEELRKNVIRLELVH